MFSNFQKSLGIVKGVASNSGATKMNLLDFIMISIMSILNIYELVYVLFKSRWFYIKLVVN